jgi:hypothetical protein
VTEIISSDKSFTGDYHDALAMLADMMIPAGEGMPSAADAEILRSSMDGLNRNRELVVQGLEALADMAGVPGRRRFADLNQADRIKLVERLKAEQADFVRTLETHILASYYRDDRVLTALGLPARAPFPGGNAVTPTDWSLLDPVRRRKPFYRIV